jgi:electron transfer flavoprotein beta subunit
MRILVAFKVTPDYETLRDADWTRVAAGDEAGTRYVRRVLNVFDESALELALRLRDEAAAAGEAAHGEATADAPELEALTVGGADSEPFLRTLLALGFARATRIEPPAPLEFAPAATASLIAARATRTEADLVLLGCRAGPGDGGLTPFFLAEALGWPCLTQLTELAPAGPGRVRVACAADDGVLRATLRLPGVLAVGNAVVSILRVPTLTQRLATRDRAVRVLAAPESRAGAAPGARGEPALLELAPIARRRAGLLMPGESPEARVRALLDALPGDLLETM